MSFDGRNAYFVYWCPRFEEASNAATRGLRKLQRGQITPWEWRQRKAQRGLSHRVLATTSARKREHSAYRPGIFRLPDAPRVRMARTSSRQHPCSVWQSVELALAPDELQDIGVPALPTPTPRLGEREQYLPVGTRKGSVPPHTVENITFPDCLTVKGTFLIRPRSGYRAGWVRAGPSHTSRGAGRAEPYFQVETPRGA